MRGASTYAQVTCGGFEAAASNGFLWLNLTNTGSLVADFTITVRLRVMRSPCAGTTPRHLLGFTPATVCA